MTSTTQPQFQQQLPHGSHKNSTNKNDIHNSMREIVGITLNDNTTPLNDFLGGQCIELKQKTNFAHPI